MAKQYCKGLAVSGLIYGLLIMTSTLIALLQH